MTLFEWIELAATLGVDGLEFYSGFLPDDPVFLNQVRDALESHQLAMPMLCCSPDFTQPDPILLAAEIEYEKRMIELTAFFGGRFCRVLSGQRRPGLDRAAGVAQVVRIVKSLLPFAEQHRVVGQHDPDRRRGRGTRRGTSGGRRATRFRHDGLLPMLAP